MTTTNTIERDMDEIYDFAPEVELLKCEDCGARVSELTYQPDWQFHGCAECIAHCEAQLAEERAEQAEPACECCYVDVDRVDATMCGLHNERRAA